MIKFNPIPMKTDAVEVRVELRGTVAEYALSFLKIYNNVKADPDLLTCRNDYGSGVYVVAVAEQRESVEEWLSNFGEVTDVTPVEALSPFVKYTTDKDYDRDVVFLPAED